MDAPTLRLPRAGAILSAELIYENRDNVGRSLNIFVRCEHEDYWSVCAGRHEPIIPVQRHTTDGWVAAIFHRGYGYIKIVGPGEVLTLPRGQTVIASVHRKGVRWEFANPPS